MRSVLLGRVSSSFRRAMEKGDTAPGFRERSSAALRCALTRSLAALSLVALSGCIVVAAPPAQEGESGTASSGGASSSGASSDASGGGVPNLPPALPPDRVQLYFTRSVSYAGSTAVEVGTTHVGGLSDCFVRRTGETDWMATLGGSGDERCMAGALASDNSVVVVGGSTSDTAGGWDAMVARYDAGGALAWEQKLGSSGSDYGHDIVTTGDRIYVVGTTGGALPGQRFSGSRFDVAGPEVSDAFLAAYTLQGERLWIRQFGTQESTEGRIGAEEGRAVAVGADGSIYVVGMTSGALFGQRSFGVGGEAFVAKFRPDGQRVWARLLGRRSGATDVVATSRGVVVVGASNVFDEGSFVAAYDSAGQKQWEHWSRPSDGDAIEEYLSVAQVGDRTLVLAQRGQEVDYEVRRQGVRIYEANAQGVTRVAEGDYEAWHLTVDGERAIVVGKRERLTAMWRLEGGQLNVHELGE